MSAALTVAVLVMSSGISSAAPMTSRAEDLTLAQMPAGWLSATQQATQGSVASPGFWNQPGSPRTSMRRSITWPTKSCRSSTSVW